MTEKGISEPYIRLEFQYESAIDTLLTKELIEDCLLSEFRGNIKDGTEVIRYGKSKDGAYNIQVGFSEETLSEYPTRRYIKRLNM